MLIFCLLVFLASPATASDEPRVAKTQVALALAPLHPGMGLWVAGPKTAAGIEFRAAAWSWDKLNGQAEGWPRGLTPEEQERTFLSFDVQGSLFIQRTLTKGPIYKSCYFAFNSNSLQREGATRSTGGNGSLEIGLGILYQPFDSIAISLRQGIAWGGGRVRTARGHWWDFSIHDMRLETRSNSVFLQSPRLWVLVYF